MKVVCYYRHSTDNAQQDANSIPRQRDNCRELIVRNGWELLEEVSDKGLSGAGDKKELMGLARRTQQGDIGFDILLCDDQARLTRKNAFRIFEDIQWLEETSIKVAFVKSNNGKPITVDEWANAPENVLIWSVIWSVDEKNPVKTGLLTPFKYPLGESNPCLRTENPMSWATRRRGLKKISAGDRHLAMRGLPTVAGPPCRPPVGHLRHQQHTTLR